MLPRTPFRFLILVWASFQLALPGVAALADAFASRTSVHAVAHVESSTERDCARVHEADCVFCQFLSAPAAPAAAVAPSLTVASIASAASSAPDAPHAPPRDGVANPRAPPLV